MRIGVFQVFPWPINHANVLELQMILQNFWEPFVTNASNSVHFIFHKEKPQVKGNVQSEPFFYLFPFVIFPTTLFFWESK